MTNNNAPIVVPLDGSKNAQNAVPFAAYVARLYDDCPVHFLHVVDPDIVKTSDDLARAREAFSKHAMKLAEEHGIKNPKPHIAEGDSAADTILRYKWEVGARFLVIATHGRGGFQALFVGSVADKVCRASRVPVFVVPGVDSDIEAPHGPVLIALDGSPQAEEGLAMGRDVAARMAAQVYLLRAYSVPPPVGVEFSYYSPDVLASFQQASEEYLTAVAQPGEEKLLVQAAPAIAIEEAANKYDAGLIVMSSSGKGLARRIALGSTTDRVMHSVRRPLLIVPVREED
jgi:nucleotide-binding universal stress UspA family protein